MPDVVYEERYPNLEHVQRGIFDAHMERIDQRADLLERQVNERFDRMQSAMKEGFAMAREHMETIMERNSARQEAFIARTVATLNGRMDRIDSRMDGVETRLSAVEGKVAQTNAMVGIIVTVFGIVTSVLIAAIQLWK